MLHTFHHPLLKLGALHYICHLEQVVVCWVSHFKLIMYYVYILFCSVIAVLKCNDNEEGICFQTCILLLHRNRLWLRRINNIWRVWTRIEKH